MVLLLTFESTAKFDSSLTRKVTTTHYRMFESTAKFDSSLTNQGGHKPMMSLRVLLNLILL